MTAPPSHLPPRKRNKVNILTLDFETFFSDDYTLKKQTTESYIRDPRFEALGCGFRLFSGELKWFGADDVEWMLNQFDWQNTAILCHHAHFDAFILSHHYGIRPAFIFDTLSMGRLVHGNSISVALASLAQYYDLPGKSVPYDLFRGRRWRELDREVQAQLGEGCCHDVEITWGIFTRLAQGFPHEEYKVIDLTCRMFTEPTLVGDQALFEKLRDEEWSRKNELLIELGVTTKQLQSADKFCHLLTAEGVEIEYKRGKDNPNGTEKWIPAIAATDDFMKGLENDDDPRVAALARARLEVRSTIDETRAGRFASMASRGPLPVYLNYCAAHTTRWGGGDRINFQNLRRGGDLRKGIRAPKGYKLGIIDLSQIEDRMLCMCAGQWDAVEDYRQGRDPYVGLASEFYGFQVDKRLHPTERGTGKQMKLSCGYGSGAATFQRTAARGTYGPPIQIDEQRSRQAIDLYRAKNQAIVQYWKKCDDLLPRMAGRSGPIHYEFGPCLVEKGRIILPNGIPMLYNLEYDHDERCWRRKTRKGLVKIWGGVVTQNIMEGLCRLILSQACLKIVNAGIRVTMLTHDEGVFLIRDDRYAQQTLEWCEDVMSTSPAWMSDIPLECEGHLSDVYDK